MADTSSILADWNLMDAADAAMTILPCNGSRMWADGVTKRRPFAAAHELLTTSDTIWASLAQSDWQHAFDLHPRLGERHAKAATSRSLDWSAQEQNAANPDVDVRAALAEANREYEAKFGRIFLLCATGRSAAEMLSILQHRMQNDAATELREAVEQQRLITQLRLRKWLAMPVLTCAELVAITRSEAA